MSYYYYELDRRSLGGVEYQTRVVLDEVKKAHDEMLRRMEGMKVTNDSTSPTIDQLNDNTDFFYINDDEDEEEYYNDDEECQREEVGPQQQQQQQQQEEEGQREVVGQ